MKRLFLVPALGAALLLSGCGPGGFLEKFKESVLTGGLSLTAPITNPVTPAMLFQLESGLVSAVAGLNTWRKLCLDLLLPQSCREQIEAVQPYTRKARPLLVSLRGFVRKNDQVNAIDAYNSLQAIIATVRGRAAAAGVQ